MTRDQAAALLNISPDADWLDVRSAYVRAVMADHPDTGTGDGACVAQLKQARDVMLSHRAIACCNLCRGVGKVRGRFGAQTCTACGGSGETK